jgi:hypothetical protein
MCGAVKLIHYACRHTGGNVGVNILKSVIQVSPEGDVPQGAQQVGMKGVELGNDEHLQVDVCPDVVHARP